jgi:type IV pilus assembly protein PilY1
VKGVPEYRYFAVVAGGPKHDVNDGHGRFNSAAPNVLFLLALDKPASERWIAGVNYFKFSMPSTDANLISGLAEVKLIAGDDGAASRAYAADLQGNVWRIDFNGTAPWPNALGGTAPKPFFTAMDDSGNRQPISQSLNVVFAPGGYLVLFGTGKLLEAKDLDAREFKPQSFYGVLDLAAERGTTIKRHQLARRIPAPGGTDRNVLRISGNAVRYGAGDKGWYFDFIDSSRTGERSILAAQIADGSVLFNTVIPGTDPCQPSTGRVYFVDTLNGLPLNAYLAGYLSTMNTTTVPMLLPARPDDIIPRDATGKIRTRKRIVVPDPVTGDLSGDAGQTKNPAVEHTTTAGRLSWREIVNWAELHTSVK